jgi:hypothetical protein
MKRQIPLLLALATLASSVPAVAQSRSAAIRSTIQAARPAIHRCVERSAKAGESPPSRVEVRVDVRPDGRVRDARVGGRASPPPELARCVETTVEGLRFPRQPGPTSLTFPLMLAD